MLTEEIRRKFLNYFKNHGHTVVSSSPVFPHDDPTLLFTNAGMNQFKDIFLGKTKSDYSRAVSSQKCVRVGGKHNDLENVGHTSRHLTFFEMLGNFSFGDYFKKEAIKLAWEVSTEVFGFAPEKIFPTVFRDDDEAFELWQVYVPAKKITRFGEKDNFWSMGDVGPCGPCSELYYDRGSRYGTATSPAEDTTGERFLEFWNLVFMQFNTQKDGSRQNLPKPSIDTGAGLERLLSLKIEAPTVFETDVLRGLIAEIENLSTRTYNPENFDQAAPFRVIADHFRCLAFAIADGVQPGNVDRGYVLRKVLRRALRYGKTLGLEDPFLARLLPRLISSMGGSYPEIKTAEGRITEILTLEEEAFIRTLKRGGNILNNIIEKAKKDSGKQLITGEDAFKLKDTYGFPLEEIALLAKDSGIAVDTAGFVVLEKEAKERSKNVHKTTHQIAGESLFAPFLQEKGPTQFTGYTDAKTTSKVLAIAKNGTFVDSLEAGDEALVILDKTPFYAEMGGQIGDTGTLSTDSSLFKVTECIAPYKGVIAHSGTLEKGTLKVGTPIHAAIDVDSRQKIANNHTATHLLHWALHEVLGKHIKQAGSVVDAERLRFDFSHHKALSPEEIAQIEDLVNSKIRENKTLKSYEISYAEAQKNTSIKQFFGEKYGASVRVVDIDNYSQELCGGTHTGATGHIGLFRIAKESSIAQGVRRIEALTGAAAESFVRQSEQLINEAAAMLKTQPGKLLERIEKLAEESKGLQQELKVLKKSQAANLATDMLKKVEIINSTPLLAAEFKGPLEEMRPLAEELLQKMGKGVLVLGAKGDGKCNLLVRISDDLAVKFTALNLIKVLAPIIEGTGGGKETQAQAGGKAPHKMEEALAKARELL